jgi:predicted kinase
VALIALAGLPGAGKSTLARALSASLPAVVFDKDEERARRFGPDRIEYSREQDDLCCEQTYGRAQAMLASAGTARTQQPGVEVIEHAILDGRCYARREQVDALRAFAARSGLPLLLVECVCSEAVACERLARDAAAGSHPAANRGPDLHRRLRAEAQPIEGPKLVLNTERLSLEEQVAQVRAVLNAGG